MKRFWLGVAILTLLLSFGIAATLGADRVCNPVVSALEAAATAIQEENWEQADLCTKQARQRWEQYRSALAALSDHTPMEEVDAQFRALEIYARQKDQIRFADCCARLSSLTGAIAEAQSIIWWNLL